MYPYSRPLESVLIKPTGPDCNMDCEYCFYLEKEAMFPESKVHRMSVEILEHTVRQVMQQGGQNVAFTWQGGEPTMMGVEFFEQAIEFEKRYGRSMQTAGNGLQTNGLLIDDRWCTFLRETPFLVGLSIDGPQHVHDHYRVRKGGQPTWERVNDTRKRMLDSGVEVNDDTSKEDGNETQRHETKARATEAAGERNIRVVA